MIKKTMVVALALSTSLTGAILADDNNYLQTELDKAMAAANANSNNSAVAAKHLHDAFNFAFQMGNYGMAKQLLGTSMQQGYPLGLWDQTALSEIYAREGNYANAKERIDYAIAGFKKAKCKYDPTWKKFASALKKNETDSIKSMFASGKPVLIQTAPSTETSHRVGEVKFKSLDSSFPAKVPVTLVISDRGRVACAALAPDMKQYSVMLSSLKMQKFKPAKVGDEKVWRYGYSFTVTHQLASGRLQREMTGGRSEGLPTSDYR